jgi:hypothetical protein
MASTCKLRLIRAKYRANFGAEIKLFSSYLCSLEYNIVVLLLLEMHQQSMFGSWGGTLTEPECDGVVWHKRDGSVRATNSLRFVPQLYFKRELLIRHVALIRNRYALNRLCGMVFMKTMQTYGGHT